MLLKLLHQKEGFLVLSLLTIYEPVGFLQLLTVKLKLLF